MVKTCLVSYHPGSLLTFPVGKLFPNGAIITLPVLVAVEVLRQAWYSICLFASEFIENAGHLLLAHCEKALSKLQLLPPPFMQVIMPAKSTPAVSTFPDAVARALPKGFWQLLPMLSCKLPWHCVSLQVTHVVGSAKSCVCGLQDVHVPAPGVAVHIALVASHLTPPEAGHTFAESTENVVVPLDVESITPCAATHVPEAQPHA